MEVLRVTSSFLSLSWNWFHGNRAINLHFLHRNYYFIFLIPHLIDLRSYSSTLKLKLISSMFVILYSNIEIKFTSQVFLLFRFDLCIWIWIFEYKFEYLNFHVQIFQYIQIQKVRILECSDSDSNIRDSSPIISNSKSILGFRFKYSNTQIQTFEYSSIQIDIQIFKIQIARWCLLQWLYLISKW